MDNAPKNLTSRGGPRSQLSSSSPSTSLSTSPSTSPSTPAPQPRLVRTPPPLPPDERGEAKRGRVAPEVDLPRNEPLGEVIADVIDAFGDTVRTRLELVEEKVLSRARAAGVQGLGAAAVAVLVLAAWVCGAVALGLWLREPLNGAAALGIIAGIHLVAAAAVAVTVGLAGRRRRET